MQLWHRSRKRAKEERSSALKMMMEVNAMAMDSLRDEHQEGNRLRERLRAAEQRQDELRTQLEQMRAQGEEMADLRAQLNALSVPLSSIEHREGHDPVTPV